MEPDRRPIGYWLQHLDRLIDGALERALEADGLTRRHWQVLNTLAAGPATRAAHAVWGAAAFLWITTGLGRVFFGGREPGFYWVNGLFWTKMALFGLVFLLELAPMVTFMRVRAARRRRAVPPAFPLAIYRRINTAETALIVLIVFVAAFMPRGVWMF